MWQACRMPQRLLHSVQLWAGMTPLQFLNDSADKWQHAGNKVL
jgi:hypothetical protein